MQRVSGVLSMKVRLFAAVCLVASLILAPVKAIDNGSIGQGFKSDQTLVAGTVVSVDDASNGTNVVAANTDNVPRLVGIVTKNSLVELSSNLADYTVATSGRALALVSDVNGEPQKGDPITASPVSGVGMKAVESTQIVGTAEASFADAEQKSKRTVTQQDGSLRTVSIGLVPVQVNVMYFNAKNDDLSFLPSFLQNIANSVAGRSVSPLRVLAALFVLVAGLGAAAVMLSASVRSSIISIGRNPLSARAVHRSLFEVGGIGIGILFVMLIAVYLILIL